MALDRRNSSPRATRRPSDDTTQKLLRLAFYSRDLMHELVGTHALDFDYVQNGKLVVHTDPALVRIGEAPARIPAHASAPSRKRSMRSAAWRSSPRSSPWRRASPGAIYTPSEDAGDCYKFCNELEAPHDLGARIRCRIASAWRSSACFRWRGAR